MTILCPAEFHAAVQHALECDKALEFAIMRETDTDARNKLEERRGQGVKTLLSCFGWRANSDARYNADPYFPAGTEIVGEDNLRRYVTDPADKYGLPVLETFVSADMAPYSFFFREVYIHPTTRRPVDVYDRCWYLFNDGRSQADVDKLSDEELNLLASTLNGDELRRTYNREQAESAEWSHRPVRETMLRRVGMCGGIIYHPDYDKDGNKLQYGSWSTHT